MNPDKNTRLFIIVLAAGLLLVGTTVFLQGQSIMKMEKSLSKIAEQVGGEYGPPPNIEQNDCVWSGGEYKNGVCDCGKDYSLENGSCVGAIGGTKKEIEESKIKQEALMQQSASESVPSVTRADCMGSGGAYKNDVCICSEGYVLEGSQCVDGAIGRTKKEIEESKIKQEALMRESEGSTDASSIVYGDFALQLPLNMDFQKIAEGRWNIISDSSKKIGELICPPMETGYEAWDFTETTKSYERGGKTLYARKLMGTAMPDAGDIGGIALIYAGMTNTQIYNPSSCQILVDLSSPATAEQRDWVDTLYGLIY
jgi:hypothetical protein